MLLPHRVDLIAFNQQKSSTGNFIGDCLTFKSQSKPKQKKLK